MTSWIVEKNDQIRLMKNEPTLQNLSNFENKSLLIVDDDNPFRERLARAMEKKGFKVSQAEGVKTVSYTHLTLPTNDQV